MKLEEPCELDVVCRTRERTIAAASHLMRERHDLVVVEELVDDHQRVIGIVTLGDILPEHTEQANRLLEVVTKQQTRKKRTRR